MATTEGKAETKQESKPEASKPESSKEVEENQEPPLKYKAWVLKVSIHCEGCKRKVEKILRNIQGVYEVSSDMKQQKVTVKANLHVNVETLIKKLVKKGRHAELWPEQKKKKSKNKDKQGDQANNEEANNNNNGGDKEKESGKNEVSVNQETAKSCENSSACKNVIIAEGCYVGKANENCVSSPCKSGGLFKEPKPEVKQNVTFMVGNHSPAVAEKKSGGGESEGNDGGGGSGSKKNKKKGQKGNANANLDDQGEHSGDAAAAAPIISVGSHVIGHGPHGPIPIPMPSPAPAYHSPPRQHPMYEYPSYHHAPPVYVTSYNTANPPSSSYSASYYALPPPYTYAYMHPGYHMSEHHPSDFHTYSSQPSNSFEIFSDENPNACSIM